MYSFPLLLFMFRPPFFLSLSARLIPAVCRQRGGGNRLHMAALCFQ